MLHDTFKPFENASAVAVCALALCLSVSSPALAVAQDEPKQEKEAKESKAQSTDAKAEAAKATTDASAKESTQRGIVLRPKSVDGSVSAYTSAVRKADPNVRVFTNADLEKMWAGDTKAWATTPSTADADGQPQTQQPSSVTPLEWAKSEQIRADNRAKAIADAELAVAAADRAVANLEKQLRAVSNPFSARPQLSSEEKKTRAEGGETPTQRKARTQQQLEEARQRAAAARQKLNRLR